MLATVRSSLTLKALRPWTILTANREELDLYKTLFSGQAFRWKKLLIEEENADNTMNDSSSALKCIYSCVLCLSANGRGEGSPLFVALRNSHVGVQFSTLLDSPVSDQELKIMLESYFQLHVSLTDLFDQWMTDGNFKEKAPFFVGQRVCRQPQIENIFSFICSSNNNIKRISGMVENLCKNYGFKVCTFLEHDFYSFPTIKQLLHACQDDLEQKLRDLGFGYRAKYIVGSAKYLGNQIDLDAYLSNLYDMPYHECRTELLNLSGVGPKVADCIALFSCGKNDVIPVDTHVLQIAERDYGVIVKTLNAKTYLEIGDAFRKAFGEYAGWAHSVLFAADLVKSQPTTKKVKKLASSIKKRKRFAEEE